MADEKPLPSGDNTPTLSWQQLLQTAIQFVAAFCGAMLPILAGTNDIGVRTILWAVCGAFIAAVASYGGSHLQLPETKRKQ